MRLCSVVLVVVIVELMGWLDINVYVVIKQVGKMGNCLKGSSADDISLLRGAENPVDSSSTDQLGPPPPYRVCLIKFA